MASQPANGRTRRTPTPGRFVRHGLPADERRGWLSHGLAALAISALGLAVAGSVSMTTSAQPIAATAPVTDTVQAGRALPAGALPGSAGALPGTAPATDEAALDQVALDQAESAAAAGSLAAFSRPLAVADSTRSAQVQAAVVKERAAQRAEDLARSAEALTQAARDAGGAARSQDLVATERVTRQAAVKLAQERLAEAIRQRVAAEAERQGVDGTSTTGPTATPGTTTSASGTDISTTVAAGGGSASPVQGAVIGAHFGQYGSWSRYHTGLDFRAGYGAQIKAVANGVVVYAGNSGDWAGNHVAIRHAGGVTTMSSHLSSMSVRAGQSVTAGQVIGYVGQTGRAFGPHLHFELYPAGVRYGDVYQAVNPVPWLRGIGVTVN